MCLGSVPIGDRKSGFGLSESKTRFTRCLLKSEMFRNPNENAALALLHRSRTSDHPMGRCDLKSEVEHDIWRSEPLTDIPHLEGFGI